MSLLMSLLFHENVFAMEVELNQEMVSNSMSGDLSKVTESETESTIPESQAEETEMLEDEIDIESSDELSETEDLVKEPEIVIESEGSEVQDEMETVSQQEGIEQRAETTLEKPSSIKVVAEGNKILKLTWEPSVNSNIDHSKIRYLIYRSESINGEYKNIGYTPFGECTYLDGGGSSYLSAGATYYYKVQAYCPDLSSSSIIYDMNPVSGVPEELPIASNEFFDVVSAEKHLRDAMLQRTSSIEIILWLKEYTSGYSKTIFNEAIADTENLSDSSGGGDYFLYHIKGYDCDFEAIRVQQNGLSKYRFVYKPKYLTTAQQEKQVDNEITRLIQGELNISENSSDFEKVKAVYEYLSTSAKYDLSLNEYGNSRVTAYDALINHKAVCQGFANAAYRMLRELGIVNRIIIGDVLWDGTWRVHAWNIVKIGEYWYNLDPTTELHFWDEYNYITYRWFLKSEQEFNSMFRRDTNRYDDAFVQTHPMGSTSIQVPLESPVLTAEAISSQTISIKWNKINRANGYELYRTSGNNGSWKLIKDIPGRETSDKDIVQGEKYYYKVRAYYRDTNGNRTYSEYSNQYVAMTLTTPVLSSSNIVLQENGIELKWNLSKGADSYAVFRSKDGKNYSCIANNVVNLPYLDTDVLPGKTYYYKIQASALLDKNITTKSSESNIKTITTLKSIALQAVAKSGVTIGLNWNNVSGISEYTIYRSEIINGTYEKVKSTTGTSTSDTGLNAGKIYYYKISGCTKTNQHTLLSNPVAVIPLATPVIEKTFAVDSGVTIQWSKASGADRYNIYRSETLTGTYEYLDSIVSGTLGYTDTSVEKNKTYYYKVRAYKKNNNIVYYGGYSLPHAVIKLDPVELTVTPKSGVTMQLTWNLKKNVYAYNVYRLNMQTGKWEYVKSTTGTSTSDTGLQAGTFYQYKIETISRINNQDFISSVSRVKGAVALATPVISNVTQSVNGLTIQWSKASGADRYNIYRSTSIDGTYQYIESVQNILNYTDTSVKNGKRYYYKVRAYKKNDGVVYYGGYSGAVENTYRQAPMLVVMPKSGVTISLSWNDTDAQYYELYGSDSKDGKYSLLKTTSGITTSHTGLTASLRYWYKIRSYTIVNGVKEYSAYSNPVAAVALAQPAILSADRQKDGTKITWSKASGADRYNVYRSTSLNGSYEYLASVQHVEAYTDTTADFEQQYYYKVRAYKKYDGIVYYGQYSSGFLAK